MAERDELRTAAEFDELAPNERSAAVRAAVVTDLGELPPAFRRHVLDTARRLSADLHEPVPE